MSDGFHAYLYKMYNVFCGWLCRITLISLMLPVKRNLNLNTFLYFCLRLWRLSLRVDGLLQFQAPTRLNA